MNEKRLLGSTMATWLSKLHLNLKKKHLKKISETFLE